MANHKSAKKRARQAEIKRVRNMMVKTKMKSAVKAVKTADSENATEILNKAKSIIDVSAKKGVIHKKTAARKISRLTKLINNMSA